MNYLFPIPEALESDDEIEEKEAVSTVDATFEHPEQVVTVTTISDVNLDGGKFTCIGPNKVGECNCECRLAILNSTCTLTRGAVRYTHNSKHTNEPL